MRTIDKKRWKLAAKWHSMPQMGNWKERFFGINSLFKSVDFEHFWVDHDWPLKFGIREGRFFCLNSLLKSVDFEHFWVDHDWPLKFGIREGRFFV